MLRPGGLCHLKDVPRTDEVGVQVGARVGQRVTDAGLSGEVNDDVGRGEIGGSLQRVRVLQHRRDGGESVGAGKDGVARLLQRDIVVRRHPVEPDDDVAVGEQPPRQVESDEAGGASDQQSHSAAAAIAALSAPSGRPTPMWRKPCRTTSRGS